MFTCRKSFNEQMQYPKQDELKMRHHEHGTNIKLKARKGSRIHLIVEIWDGQRNWMSWQALTSNIVNAPLLFVVNGNVASGMCLGVLSMWISGKTGGERLQNGKSKGGGGLQRLLTTAGVDLDMSLWGSVCAPGILNCWHACDIIICCDGVSQRWTPDHTFSKGLKTVTLMTHTEKTGWRYSEIN